jgi:pimeloyl-ACP methyl ester carboxylesterase
VLIHGLSGSARWWAQNIRAFAERFQVFIVDLVGFGDSRCAHPFVLDEAAGLLINWMDAIGIEQATLVGHSMGGFIAAEFAADFPNRIDSLILVDAAALPLRPGYARQAFDLTHIWRSTSLDFLPILLSDALRAGPLTLAKAAYQLLTADLRPKLAQITAPTLVVWGEHDIIVPLELGRRLCAYIPDVREFVIIKRAGHNPMWDCPAVFNRVVSEFLTNALDSSACARAAA